MTILAVDDTQNGWLDLRARFERLHVPLRTAPADLDEAQADIDMAATWSSSQ